MREFLFYMLILVVSVPFLYMTIEVLTDIFRRLTRELFPKLQPVKIRSRRFRR